MTEISLTDAQRLEVLEAYRVGKEWMLHHAHDFQPNEENKQLIHDYLLNHCDGQFSYENLDKAFAAVKSKLKFTPSTPETKEQ